MIDPNKHIDDFISNISNQINDVYYAWIRHIIALSSGALTLLIAFKNNYVPANPEHLILLKACWVFLILTILLGIVASYGETSVLLDVRKKSIEFRNLPLEQRLNHQIFAEPRKSIFYAQRAVPLTFGGSLLFLALFAVLNV